MVVSPETRERSTDMLAGSRECSAVVEVIVLCLANCTAEGVTATLGREDTAVYDLVAGGSSCVPLYAR